jgi:capsular exopolysaccharide synthesis family protein
MHNETKNNEYETTIDLLKLARFLFTPGHIVTMLVVCIVCGVVAYAYSAFMLPELYESSLSMYVTSSDRARANDSIDVANLTVSRNLADSYVVVLSNDVVMEEIGTVLINTYSEEELLQYFPIDERDGKKYIKAKYISACFNIAPVDETEVLKVSVTTADPQLSADLCNIMGEVAPAFLKRVVGAGSVEAIGDAVAPDSKCYPSNKGNAAKGAVAGLMICCAVFVIRILLDNKVRDTDSFREKFDYPVMGEIPLITENDGTEVNETAKKKKGDNSAVEIDSFTAVEAFNTLCNNLIITMTMNDEKTVVVSSPDMSDGKSTVSLNMAKTMAKLNKKVLLIDLDLRRPSIHKKIHTNNKTGVLSIIAKSCDLSSAIIKDEESGLDILLSGGVSPNPSEVLASNRCKDILNECKAQYDFVIIDSPPINAVTDSCIVSQMAAGIVVVLRSNESRFDDFKRVTEHTDMAQSKIVGVVINGVNEQTKKYGGRYHYRYGYKYGYKYGYENSYESSYEKNKK